MAPQEMQHELAILKTSLTSLHPGIYRYETPSQIDADFATAFEKVKQPLPENRYMILIAQLLTHAHCGHTYTNYWNQTEKVGSDLFSKSYMPFLYKMIGKEMVITHNLSGADQIRVGDRVIAINGLPVTRIVDSLLTVSLSDGLHGLPRKIDNINIEPSDIGSANFNMADIYIPLFFPQLFNTASYRLTIQHYPYGKPFEVNVLSLNKKNRMAVYEQRFGVLPIHEQDWSLKILTKQTACFTIGGFDTWAWKKDYRILLDSIFTVLKKQHIANLIVDIRGNVGGADDARDEVFTYLTDKPFGCTDPLTKRVRFLTVPDTLTPYLKTWDKSFKQPKNPADYRQLPDGLYENIKESQEACITVQPKPNRFTGKIFLLIDNRNSSTTFTLAKLFKTMHTGKIIGETTGGNQQGINGGQFFFLYLPYSGLEIDIPLTWGAYIGNRPDTGIEPDYFVPTTRQTLSAKKDAQIEFALKRIRNK